VKIRCLRPIREAISAVCCWESTVFKKVSLHQQLSHIVQPISPLLGGEAVGFVTSGGRLLR
jgi:hypothetical protein